MNLMALNNLNFYRILNVLISITYLNLVDTVCTACITWIMGIQSVIRSPVSLYKLVFFWNEI